MRIVQIIGAAMSLSPVPELPEGAERWGLNNLWLDARLQPRYKGWTRWFDLHSTEHIQTRKSGNIYPWLCKQTQPVMRWEIDPAMPSSEAYPHEAVRAAFGGTRLFASSFDWEMALAIYKAFERIDLFGWSMCHPRYQHQVKSGQFWIRKAMEAGIEVVNHSKSSLFIVRHPLLEPESTSRCLMYGLETTDRSKLYSHRFTK